MVRLHLKNIHPDYKRRLSIDQTLQQFNAFLYNEKDENIESLKELSIEIEKINHKLIKKLGKILRNKNFK